MRTFNQPDRQAVLAHMPNFLLRFIQLHVCLDHWLHVHHASEPEAKQSWFRVDELGKPCSRGSMLQLGGIHPYFLIFRPGLFQHTQERSNVMSWVPNLAQPVFCRGFHAPHHPGFSPPRRPSAAHLSRTAWQTTWLLILVR